MNVGCCFIGRLYLYVFPSTLKLAIKSMRGLIFNFHVYLIDSRNVKTEAGQNALVVGPSAPKEP